MIRTLPVLFLLVMLNACTGKDGNIEGTYVRTFQNEYAFGVDTITIEKIGKENTYLIHKNSGYQRIINGKITDAIEYNHAKWLALFDTQTGILTTDPDRKVISVHGNGETLQLGNSIYKKGN